MRKFRKEFRKEFEYKDIEINAVLVQEIIRKKIHILKEHHSWGKMKKGKGKA